jgi:hypothetical protein
VLTRDHSLVPMADTLSKLAIAQLPNSAEIVGARGGVLVQLGEIDAGIALLTAAVPGVGSGRDKIEFIDFLSATQRANGNRSLADELDNARKFLAESLRNTPNLAARPAA